MVLEGEFGDGKSQSSGCLINPIDSDVTHADYSRYVTCVSAGRLESLRLVSEHECSTGLLVEPTANLS